MNHALNQPPPLVAALGLEPHPEGGRYRRFFTAAATVPHPSAASLRPTATLIHYLLEPGQASAWHTVASEEVWLWRTGGRLRLHVSPPGPAPTVVTEIILGPYLSAGDHLDALVPADHWQSAEPADDAEVLVTCMVTPGFDFADLEMLETPGEDSPRGGGPQGA